MPTHYNRKILAVMTSIRYPNTWVYVDGGVGWLFISHVYGDVQVTTMTDLAVHAKADNRYVTISEDPARWINWMYVW